MSNTVFPFTIKAYSTPHYTASPNKYKGYFVRSFLASSPKGSTYFAYDVAVVSRTEVEFIAYDMFDSVYGGIGAEVWRGVCEVPASLTDEDVENRITSLAKTRRVEEKAAAERLEIDRHISEIRAEMDMIE